ncbi:anaerobic ribonucleoside-triphosphate reductase activating protein [Sulfurihydrogenibium subterraneum]|uniref:anaerobic ribonucleoside-triphosphate reductase activating protein n=1 Tax=Sulfurihydrogenibium subterraneum TaxID=171121 RepID=UPI00056BCE4A|nr:anaerobic ribonucleoside-triphosphate reductase activating protein [Sulfurihydrogenibium subterraneum]
MPCFIYDLTPFTLLDYPDNVSAIVWFTGCNFRCDYCYNPDIVFSKEDRITEEQVLDFLKKRVGLLDGVVFCGGEPTFYKNLENFAKKVKNLGFKIKLDTNGTNPDVVQILLEEKIIDYVALDYKAPEYKFKEITKTNTFDRFGKTLEILINSNINFEVRTTVHSDLITEEDVNEIILDLYNRGFRKVYYIQNYIHTPNIGNLGKPSKNFDITKIKKDLINIKFRNFDNV